MTSPIPISQRGQRTQDQPISYFMQQAVENPQLISLAAGLVDAESLPAKEVADAASEILGSLKVAQAALQYGTTQGSYRLRETLLARTAALDEKTPAEMGLTPNDCVITTGSQQFLYLISEALLDPGDIVITAAPSYFVYQGTLQSMGVRILSVPNHAEGMDTDALAELLAKLARENELRRVKLIYVVDYFDNPTGATLSLPRRRHVLDLARTYSRGQRILVLEDAAYRELRYDGDDLASIKSFDPSNEFVILAMTFSKPLSPGLKTGYAFVPTELRGPILRLKGNHDFGSNNFTQHVIHHVLKTGAYDRHVAELREVYRHKRDVTLNALLREFDPKWAVHWLTPKGGMYVWLTFPKGSDTGPAGSLVKDALREGVLYVPGEFCYANASNGVPRNEIRLCFGVATPSQIEEAIKRLATAVAGQFGNVRSSGPGFTADQPSQTLPADAEAVCCYVPTEA